MARPIIQPTQWYCETCDRIFQKSSKSKHLKSQRHLQLVSPPSEDTLSVSSSPVLFSPDSSSVYVPSVQTTPMFTPLHTPSFPVEPVESVGERTFQNLYRGPPCMRRGFVLRLENALPRGKIVDLEGREFPLYGHTYTEGFIFPRINRGSGPRIVRCRNIITELQNAGILSLEHLERSGSIHVIHSRLRTPVYDDSSSEVGSQIADIDSDETVYASGVEELDEVHVQTQECTICMSQKSNFHSCTRCVHSWCDDCQSHMHRCPYCRKPFGNPVRRLTTEQLRAIETRMMRRIALLQFADLFPMEWSSYFTQWVEHTYVMHREISVQVQPIVRQMLEQFEDFVRLHS